MTLAEQFQPMLDKSLPAALLAAFLLQTAGALFWAGSAANFLSLNERLRAAGYSPVEGGDTVL